MPACEAGLVLQAQVLRALAPSGTSEGRQPALLELREVWLRYDPTREPWALRGVTLECRRGQTIGICGRTGALRTLHHVCLLPEGLW